MLFLYQTFCPRPHHCCARSRSAPTPHPALTPALQLYQFYPLDSITFPFAIMEASVNVANVVAAPLAGLLLLMDGVSGMVSQAVQRCGSLMACWEW